MNVIEIFKDSGAQKIINLRLPQTKAPESIFNDISRILNTSMPESHIVTEKYGDDYHVDIIGNIHEYLQFIEELGSYFFIKKGYLTSNEHDLLNIFCSAI